MSNDPIGTASARLLGDGVDPAERLFALRVLGLLLDRADGDGRVVVSWDELARSGGLDGQRVALAYERLQRARTLRRTGGGWAIDGWAGWRRSGVPPADALAVIGSALGR